MRLSFEQWREKNHPNATEPNDQAQLIGKYADYVGGFIAGQAEQNSEEQTKLAQKLSDDFAKALQPMQEALKAQGVEMQKLKDASKSDPSVKPSGITKADLTAIRAVASNDQKTHRIDGLATKALTTTASVVNNGYALDLPTVGQLKSRRNSFLEYLENNGMVQEVPTSANGTVRYVDWDEATKVRAAAMIAEGATFPESTAAWQTYTVKLKKVADILPWTDEFEYDDAFLVGELQRFLVININLIKGTQIINGDGTGNNLEGIFNVSPAYTPVAAGITDASIYDLIVKLREAIETGQRNGVQVDFALMNITDINKYKLKKDGENNYIMPPFYDADGNRIDGVTIIEDNAVPANTMVIGDSRYTMIYREPGLNVEIGYSGTDFEEGKKRMRVYERCLFLIRTVDRTAFLEVTDIDAALTTLAS